MKAGELIKSLKKNGWELVRVTGSHHTFKHPGFRDHVTVPVHGGDLKKVSNARS